MICNYCNREIDDNVSFCKYCGASVIGSGSTVDTSNPANFDLDTASEIILPKEPESTTAFNNNTFNENSSDNSTFTNNSSYDFQNSKTDYKSGYQQNYNQDQSGYSYGPNSYNANQPAGSNNKGSSQGEGLAIASLVIGIGQMLCFCIPYLNLIPAVIGLVLGVLGLKSNKRGLAIAGIVLCCIFLFLSLIYTIWFTYDTLF